MSGILAYACCCGGGCQPQRDFSVTMRFRATCEFYRRFESIVDVGCTSPPDCTLPTVPCACPTIGACQATYTVDTPSVCEASGYEAHYLTSFDMAAWTVTVPFVSTGAEFVVNSPGCTWYADPFGTGLIPSGLNYQGLRNIDTNSTTLTYDLTVSTCAGCVTLTPSPTGAYSQNLTIRYYHRCSYSQPPFYMSIQRNAGAGYAGWTWEITGGVFITRNLGGVIQNALNLVGLTMAAATAAINAWPEIIALGFGATAAAAWPAIMWEDRAAALIPFPAAGPVYIFAPGRRVENYQEGTMGPRWEVAQDPTAPCNHVNSYPLKVGCDLPDPCDYEGGTDAKAEEAFCQGIGAAFCNYVTEYDPTTGIGETNFRNWCANVNNWPTGFWSCEGGVFIWNETPCTVPEGDPGIAYWGICLGGFGNRAMSAASTFEVCSDDPGAWPSTYCVATATLYDCDFCGCAPLVGPQVGQGCVKLQERQGWALSKFFSITRL